MDTDNHCRADRIRHFAICFIWFPVKVAVCNVSYHPVGRQNGNIFFAHLARKDLSICTISSFQDLTALQVDKYYRKSVLHLHLLLPKRSDRLTVLPASYQVVLLLHHNKSFRFPFFCCCTSSNTATASSPVCFPSTQERTASPNETLYPSHPL